MPGSSWPYEIAATLAFLNACRVEYQHSFKRQAFREEQIAEDLRYAAWKEARKIASAPKASLIPELQPTCSAWIVRFSEILPTCSASSASMVPQDKNLLLYGESSLIPELLSTCSASNMSTVAGTNTTLSGVDTLASYHGSPNSDSFRLLFGLMLGYSILLLLFLAIVSPPEILVRAKRLISHHSSTISKKFLILISPLLTLLDWYCRMKDAACQYLLRVLDTGLHKAAKVISDFYHSHERTLPRPRHWISPMIINETETVTLPDWYCRVKGSAMQYIMRVYVTGLDKTAKFFGNLYRPLKRILTSSPDWTGLTVSGREKVTELEVRVEAYQTVIRWMVQDEQDFLAEMFILKDQLLQFEAERLAATETRTRLENDHTVQLETERLAAEAKRVNLENDLVEQFKTERLAADAECAKLKSDHTDRMNNLIDDHSKVDANHATEIDKLKQANETNIRKAWSARDAKAEELKKSSEIATQQREEIDTLKKRLHSADTRNTELSQTLDKANGKIIQQANEIDSLKTRSQSLDTANIQLGKDLKNAKEETPQLPETGPEEAGDPPAPAPAPPPETGDAEKAARKRRRQKRTHNPDGMTRDQCILHLKTLAPVRSKSGNRARYQNIDYGALADMMEGWSGMEIQEAVARAKRIASGEADGIYDPRRIYQVEQGLIEAQVLEMEQERAARRDAEVPPEDNDAPPPAITPENKVPPHLRPAVKLPPA